ncbi:MAG TPA: cofactor-independent phosphoglycerate mutase [Candidatus Acidoferrales bacterium]|nr:cofactor-independent phosphoglycerate mutase [Candidatus Acidoferrales bacterium]
MKYIIIQADGMADWPIAALGGKTPLEQAKTPHMDWLARRGVCGLVHTIPAGFPPGSDIGNMTILGYDPAAYHTGRSPLEAASIGVRLGPRDIAFRCNLVTLRGSGSEAIMEDFTAGHITTAEADEIIRDLNRALARDNAEFHTGVSYRHLMVWRNGKEAMQTTPPHDITDQKIAGYLPQGDGADFLNSLMAESQRLLAAHPVNQRRAHRGEKRATTIWLWGQGRAPSLPPLTERFGIRGGVISAVDIINGLGFYAGLERVRVPGITGFLDTNYKGKGEYAVAALEERDFMFVHIEATDEAGHMGDAAAKVRAIEDIDEKVIGTVLEGMRGRRDWRLLLVSDHATPIALKTHCADPVPFALYDASRAETPKDLCFSERAAGQTGVVVRDGTRLIEALMRGDEPWK